MITVQHQAIALDWLNPNALENPQTLVIGSFNPFDPEEEDNLDYYYGRASNHFWKSIARNIIENEDYFFNNIHRHNRKVDIMRGRFCCLDVINSIDFECANEQRLTNYLNENVFANFSDSKIFGSRVNYGGHTISIKRNYNDTIHQLLRETNSISRVIHTMGSRIQNINEIKPIEHHGDPIGFREYIRQIVEICENREIEFDFYSLSPSQYAVNNGATLIADLDNWLRNKLNLDN